MDDRRFDALTRMFARETSRRTLVRNLAASAFASLTSTFRAPLSRCRRPGRSTANRRPAPAMPIAANVANVRVSATLAFVFPSARCPVRRAILKAGSASPIANHVNSAIGWAAKTGAAYTSAAMPVSGATSRTMSASRPATAVRFAIAKNCSAEAANRNALAPANRAIPIPAHASTPANPAARVKAMAPARKRIAPVAAMSASRAVDAVRAIDRASNATCLGCVPMFARIPVRSVRPMAAYPETADRA